jgi:hypothetical protein
MYLTVNSTCYVVVHCNNRSRLGIYNIPRKNINPNFKKLVNKCSNPLNYHKKSCIAFWDYIDKFNQNIDSISYEIETMDTNNSDFDFNLKACDQNDDGTFILDECKVFDD